MVVTSGYILYEDSSPIYTRVSITRYILFYTLYTLFYVITLLYVITLFYVNNVLTSLRRSYTRHGIIFDKVRVVVIYLSSYTLIHSLTFMRSSRTDIHFLYDYTLSYALYSLKTFLHHRRHHI